MRIRFDASGCDPILTENAQPWTASLVRESQDETHSVKLANWMEPGQREYNLVITAPSTTDQAPEQTPPSDFHVQVHSTTADGRVRLVGKTESFSIADALVKRQDVRFLPPDQATPPPPPANAPVFPAPPTADPNSNVDPSIPAPPASEAPKFPIPDSPTPEPTFPNTPAPPPADPATLPAPLNPPVEGVVLPSVTGPTPQPKRTNAATFLKYAGAGGAILSTIGTGVGGLVGGVVGGTIGLVLGLVIAGVNSVITF
ncbi:hypothetical protein BGZ98_005317 [Dissophora globulifera]|nr:hypothetical protein BGZ98_005317 [Dissophora globulifera]